MKNAENVRKLLHAMNGFALAYDSLKVEINNYEQETGASVNDLPGFTKHYPFDKSFDELAVDQWVSNTVEKVRQTAFKVLDYEYLNTGGHCMVGIFEVWLPERNQTVYVLTNEEGYSMVTVDYLRRDLDIYDYDELTIECSDWCRLTGNEKYFELYKYCLNEYTKSDCRYFGSVTQLPINLLCDELKNQITEDYAQWLKDNEYDSVETDGQKIIMNPYYEAPSEEDELLKAINEFKLWHSSTAGLEEYYNEMYTLEFAGHKVELPFMADVWDAVDTLLDRVIQDW